MAAGVPEDRDEVRGELTNFTSGKTARGHSLSLAVFGFGGCVSYHDHGGAGGGVGLARGVAGAENEETEVAEGVEYRLCCLIGLVFRVRMFSWPCVLRVVGIGVSPHRVFVV